MPTTLFGFPYPAPTDPVSLGAADIRALAESLDAQLPMKLLMSHTVPSIAAIDLANIPQTYTDLRVVVVARSSAATASQLLMLRINGATGSYATQRSHAVGATVSAQGLGSDTWGFAGTVPNSADGVDAWGVADILFPNYHGAGFRTWVAQSFAPIGGSSGAVATAGGIYFGATAALTRLTFLPSAAPNTFAIGSRISIYGLRA